MKLRNTLDAMGQTIDELASLGSHLTGWQADQHAVEIAHLRRQLGEIEKEFARPRPKRFQRGAPLARAARVTH